MDIDPSEEEGEYSKKAEALRTITTDGPLPSSVAKLSGSSRGISSGKDFHFYYNFEQFNAPIQEIDETSTKMLHNVGVSSQSWGKLVAYPESLDCDDIDIYDWLVNVNDDVFEKLDASIDEFRGIRKKEEEEARCARPKMGMEDSESGFQMVLGKKNRKGGGGVSSANNEKVAGVQLTSKTKPKVPFHIPTIPRPQDEYKIIVNNSNQPFDHVWLQRSQDGSRFIHPLVST